MTSLSAVLALALGLAAVTPSTGLRSRLPPAPLQLYRIAWQRPFVGLRALETGPQERGGVAVDAQRGIAFLGTRDGWLHAIRRDGSVVWEVRGEGGGFGQPAVDGDTVYAGSADGRLYAVAIPTGKVRWTYDAREDLSTRPAVAGGVVMVASQQDTVFGVDAATGAWRWHHRRERRGESFTIFGAASVQVSGASAYAAYSDGYVAALDPRTGAARWQRPVAPAGTQLDVDALAHDGDRLYAAAYSGAVIALDPRTGETVWTFQATGASQLAVAPGLLVAVTASSVVGLSPVSGAPLWTAPLDGSPSGAPALAGKWLLVPAGKGGLRWFEAASGRLLRVFEPGTGVFAPPGVAGGRVYVLSNGGDLFALDLG